MNPATDVDFVRWKGFSFLDARSSYKFVNSAAVFQILRSSIALLRRSEQNEVHIDRFTEERDPNML